ncbi:hypothetical protein AGDE_02952 [Angomonas deanei]|nr:hypothetical protein AGDE_02952 [Angomonas deanei]|eukprot:EPY40973.1 hypothetical protein AGDE_02952 [Angomonas deanei]
MQEEEEVERKWRIRRLKCIIRRIELEKAVKDGELGEEEFGEYDLSDVEEELFEGHRDELIQLKRTPPAEVFRELETLQRASQLYLSQSKGNAVLSRKDNVRKEMLKKEVKLVKEGAKQKPFFPKRSAVKRALIEDTYEHLDKTGGKQAVDRYLARKTKRQRL